MTIKTYSVLDKLRAGGENAEAHLRRCQVRYDDLRREYQRAKPSEYRAIEKRGFTAKARLAEAERELDEARAKLEAEEQRLLQPDSFLRFG